MNVPLRITRLAVDVMHTVLGRVETLDARIRRRILDCPLSFECFAIEGADHGIDSLEGLCDVLLRAVE